MTDPGSEGEQRSPDTPSDKPARGVAAIADGEERALAPGYISAERVNWWIVTAAIGLGTLLPVSLSFLGGELLRTFQIILGTIWLVVTAALLWLTQTWPRLQHRHTRYRVTPIGLEIRRGVIWRRITDVPLSRVQHTDVQQGPIQRHFGVATLIVHTAGTTAASVSLGGLSHEDALRIRDFLVQKSSGDDGV